MSFRCCSLIQMSALNISGRIETGKPVISLCCESLPNIPKIGFMETAEDTLRAFVGESALVSMECMRCSKDSQRYFTAGCTQCANFIEGDYPMDAVIHYVNLSMYPAPCQSRCIYCSVHKEDQRADSSEVQAAYEKLFDMLDLAERSGILVPNAQWQVSSGEIAIHPYRERIMKLVRGKRAMFYTNCMKFDEDVAQNLHDNPNSAINLSIDAGTPGTWKKIKGVDNFKKVTENLARYYTQSARPGQIVLKYIILPDVNDIYEDFQSLMEIMKALKVEHLTISRDVRNKYSMSREDTIKLTGAAAYLLAMCHKNGIANDMFTYTKQEQAEAIQLAQEILRRKQV